MASGLSRAAALLLLSGGLFPAQAQETPVIPSFVEETGSAGITSIFEGDWEYMVGGGAAAGPCPAGGGSTTRWMG